MKDTHDKEGRAPEGAAHCPPLGDPGGAKVRRFARIRRSVVEVKPVVKARERFSDPEIPDPDPDHLWRKTWDEICSDTTPPQQMGALQRADLIGAVAEWTWANPYPSIRAGGALILRALDEHRRGEPFGRALGLEPAAGLVARTAIGLAERNTLIRSARASVPEWAAAPPRQAARAIVAAFRRYETTTWLHDRDRHTAPAGDAARAAFWRILRSGLPMPDAPRVAQLLA